MNQLADQISDTLRKFFNEKGSVHLSEPSIDKVDIDEVVKCLESGWVSSAGPEITKFEELLKEMTGAKYCIATVNGTAALHLSMICSGLKPNQEVLTPALTFVGTTNPILYSNAIPHFIESEEDSLGIDAQKLKSYLKKIVLIKNGKTFNSTTGRELFGLISMHTFGLASKTKEILEVCEEFNLKLIEDAAEALGTYDNGKHVGLAGSAGILSFNGNKVITTGGGGAVITNDEEIASNVRHLSTTAKVPHAYEFIHDQIGYNYRMPNLNASLGVAQMTKLSDHLKSKRSLHSKYEDLFLDMNGVTLISELKDTKSNYWLNAILLDEENIELRNKTIESCIAKGIMVRPVWKLQSELDAFKAYPKMDLEVATSLSKRIINLPSSPGLI